MDETTIVTEMNEEKAYTLRNLMSKDVFPMLVIVRKIGIKEFKNCFESAEVLNMIKDKSEEDGPTKANEKAIGMKIIFDIAMIIIERIPSCENEIYQLLSQLSGMPKKELEEMPMVTFTEMIIDVLKKDEFKDFIGVVSKLLK